MQVRFSQNLQALLQRLVDHPLTLHEILVDTAERGFSLVIGLLTLPFLFPMPPGLTTILGSGSLLLALQMALGRRSPWLPKQIRKFRFPDWFAKQLLHNLQRLSRVLEKFAKPRLRKLVDNPLTWRITGVSIAWLTVLLMLPIPLTNPIPAVPTLILVVATMEEDGVLMCVGYGLTVLVTLFFGAIGLLLWQVPTALESLGS